MKKANLIGWFFQFLRQALFTNLAQFALIVSPDTIMSGDAVSEKPELDYKGIFHDLRHVD